MSKINQIKMGETTYEVSPLFYSVQSGASNSDVTNVLTIGSESTSLVGTKPLTAAFTAPYVYFGPPSTISNNGITRLTGAIMSPTTGEVNWQPQLGMISDGIPALGQTSSFASHSRTTAVSTPEGTDVMPALNATTSQTTTYIRSMSIEANALTRIATGSAASAFSSADRAGYNRMILGRCVPRINKALAHDYICLGTHPGNNSNNALVQDYHPGLFATLLQRGSFPNSSISQWSNPYSSFIDDYNHGAFLGNSRGALVNLTNMPVTADFFFGGNRVPSPGVKIESYGDILLQPRSLRIAASPTDQTMSGFDTGMQSLWESNPLAGINVSNGSVVIPIRDAIYQSLGLGSIFAFAQNMHTAFGNELFNYNSSAAPTLRMGTLSSDLTHSWQTVLGSQHHFLQENGDGDIHIEDFLAPFNIADCVQGLIDNGQITIGSSGSDEPVTIGTVYISGIQDDNDSTLSSEWNGLVCSEYFSSSRALKDYLSPTGVTNAFNIALNGMLGLECGIALSSGSTRPSIYIENENVQLSSGFRSAWLGTAYLSTPASFGTSRFTTVSDLSEPQQMAICINALIDNGYINIGSSNNSNLTMADIALGSGLAQGISFDPNVAGYIGVEEYQENATAAVALEPSFMRSAVFGRDAQDNVDVVHVNNVESIIRISTSSASVTRFGAVPFIRIGTYNPGTGAAGNMVQPQMVANDGEMIMLAPRGVTFTPGDLSTYIYPNLSSQWNKSLYYDSANISEKTSVAVTSGDPRYHVKPGEIAFGTSFKYRVGQRLHVNPATSSSTATTRGVQLHNYEIFEMPLETGANYGAPNTAILSPVNATSTVSNTYDKQVARDVVFKIGTASARAARVIGDSTTKLTNNKVVNISMHRIVNLLLKLGTVHSAWLDADLNVFDELGLNGDDWTSTGATTQIVHAF